MLRPGSWQRSLPVMPGMKLSYQVGLRVSCYSSLFHLRQHLLHIFQRQTIDDILLLQPAFPRDADADAEKLQIRDVVGVGVDGALDTEFLGMFPETPIHVEAI